MDDSRGPASIDLVQAGAGVVEEEMPVEEPGWTTVTVGATVAVVAAETVAVESPARALAVVTAVDPIAALEPAERIVTFG